jgi:hypothetical protein
MHVRLEFFVCAVMAVRVVTRALVTAARAAPSAPVALAGAARSLPRGKRCHEVGGGEPPGGRCT